MLDILTIGDIKLDTFLTLDGAASVSGESLCVPLGKKNTVVMAASQVAGSAPNLAIGIAKMKKSSAVLSAMGADITHQAALAFLQENGVDTDFITAYPKRQSSFAAVLNFAGESTQLVAHAEVDIRLPKTAPRTAWIHVSELGKGYDALFGGIVRYAKDDDIRISFNPGQVAIEERKKSFFDLIAVTNVLFINLREARELLRLSAKTSIRSTAAKLHDLGAKSVVVTDGQQGAYAFDGAALVHAPMFPGKRVEATGAGDAFATGYLGALMHGKNTDEALMWGSVNAASVVGFVGPTKGLLSHADIMKRLKARPSYNVKIV